MLRPGRCLCLQFQSQLRAHWRAVAVGYTRRWSFLLTVQSLRCRSLGSTGGLSIAGGQSISRRRLNVVQVVLQVIVPIRLSNALVQQSVAEPVALMGSRRTGSTSSATLSGHRVRINVVDAAEGEGKLN